MSNDVLTLDVFNALMEAKAYVGDTVMCAKQVQAVYMRLAKRDWANLECELVPTHQHVEE